MFGSRTQGDENELSAREQRKLAQQIALIDKQNKDGSAVSSDVIHQTHAQLNASSDTSLAPRKSHKRTRPDETRPDSSPQLSPEDTKITRDDKKPKPLHKTRKASQRNSRNTGQIDDGESDGSQSEETSPQIPSRRKFGGGVSVHELASLALAQEIQKISTTESPVPSIPHALDPTKRQTRRATGAQSQQKSYQDPPSPQDGLQDGPAGNNDDSGAIIRNRKRVRRPGMSLAERIAKSAAEIAEQVMQETLANEEGRRSLWVDAVEFARLPAASQIPTNTFSPQSQSQSAPVTPTLPASVPSNHALPSTPSMMSNTSTSQHSSSANHLPNTPSSPVQVSHKPKGIPKKAWLKGLKHNTEDKSNSNATVPSPGAHSIEIKRESLPTSLPSPVSLPPPQITHSSAQFSQTLLTTQTSRPTQPPEPQKPKFQASPPQKYQQHQLSHAHQTPNPSQPSHPSPQPMSPPINYASGSFSTTSPSTFSPLSTQSPPLSVMPSLILPQMQATTSNAPVPHDEVQVFRDVSSRDPRVKSHSLFNRSESSSTVSVNSPATSGTICPVQAQISPIHTSPPIPARPPSPQSNITLTSNPSFLLTASPLPSPHNRHHASHSSPHSFPPPTCVLRNHAQTSPSHHPSPISFSPHLPPPPSSQLSHITFAPPPQNPMWNLSPPPPQNSSALHPWAQTAFSNPIASRFPHQQPSHHTQKQQQLHQQFQQQQIHQQIQQQQSQQQQALSSQWQKKQAADSSHNNLSQPQVLSVSSATIHHQSDSPAFPAP